MPVLRWQIRNFYYRADFDGAFARAGNAAGNVDGFIEVFGVDQVITAQLLARLRERTVGHEPFAVTDLHAGSGRDRLQRTGGQKLAVRLELVRELGRLPVTLFPLRVAPG